MLGPTKSLTALVPGTPSLRGGCHAMITLPDLPDQIHTWPELQYAVRGSRVPKTMGGFWMVLGYGFCTCVKIWDVI